MFKELKGKKINSVVLNEQKSTIVFRDNDDYLYFYVGNVESITGMSVLDMKYGAGMEGAYVVKTRSNKLYTSDGEIVVGGEVSWAGSIKESVLKSLDKFEQVFEDFYESEIVGRTSCVACTGTGCDRCVPEEFENV